MPSPPLSIVQSLSPRVAVLASDDVTDSCAANGCSGLDELLRPWEGGTERVQIMSSTLTPTVHPTFPLRFVSYSSVYGAPGNASPAPEIVVDLISSCVGKHQPDEEQHYSVTRALLLNSRPLAPHETFNHPVGVLFAISTSTPDAMATLTRMYGQAVGTGAQAAPWMDGVQVLKFFVVVHDVSKKGPDLEQAQELLGQVKKSYGPHSTLLVINSREQTGITPPLESPDLTAHAGVAPLDLAAAEDPCALSQLYASTMSSLTLSPMAAAAHEAGVDGGKTRRRYAAKLSVDDVQALIALVRELVVQSLVPWMEARVREWNEAYQTNRRGLTGRLFGAGRKLFSSRPASPTPSNTHHGYNAVKGYYAASSVEALARRLADFAFMLRDYRHASGVYDSLRKDYAQDRAWRYAAAATEMYGLALLLGQNFFMPNTPPSTRVSLTTMQHTEVSSWLEQAVATYQSRGGTTQVQLDALRITVLYYEAWKAINEWRGVGAALVRAAGEADEVPCAVIIEEAAATDVRGAKRRGGKRRQAFHLVMAARRYEKAGLKQYSRRCLEEAASLLRDAHWGAVRDRVEHSLGRQAYTLGESDVAVVHFLKLLARDDLATPGTQGMVLEDLAQAYEQLALNPEQLAAAADKLRLPTPVFDVKKTSIVLAAEGSGAGRKAAWATLDARVLAHWDRKGKKPASVLPDARRIVAAVGEELTVELVATNPLNTPIVLADLTLDLEGDGVSSTRDEVALDPHESRQISLTVTPRAAGTLSVKSARFTFHRFLPTTQSLERRGRRLHATKAQRVTPTYAPDTTLTVHVEGSTPRVAAHIIGVPDAVLAGEVVDAELRLRNSGAQPVEDVQLLTSHYGVISLFDSVPSPVPNAIAPNRPFSVHAGIIQPGQDVAIPIRFSYPTPGRLELLALATFSTADGTAGAAKIAHTADIRPVVSISSEVRPARNGWFVSLDVANHADVPLQIEPPVPVSEYFSSTVLGGGATLHPNQRVRCVLSVKPGNFSGDLAQSALVTNLGKLLRGEDLSPVSPTTVSVKVPPGFLASRRAHRLSFAGEHLPALPTDMVPKLLPLFDPLDLDVAFPWTAGDRHGVACAHAIRPTPAFSLVEGLREDVGPAKRTMYEETGRLRRALADSVLEGVYADEGDPVSVRATVAGAVRGRLSCAFDDGLVLPITLTIENRSPALPARWTLRLPPPRYPSSVLYTGALEHRGTLPPGGSMNVETGVWVTEPGLLQLGGWEVERETGEPESSEDERWTPRASWAGVEHGPLIEVVRA
ncbi:hypothetical protein CcaverHIS002_0212610 [Cutaneotrichosporon cavernicola]|uniref:Trs120/TRAPPC9 first Ig-like domain-containing protein n=1 Tax=Cutaneotrichosporon cavernicola TaxID=279322 RepID=A0AA48KYY8_9TREE|nr:uncharacterized protein CcaverHIS019_0212610 [Cutaneotrichosporon cavernicola]BEI82101.1 hypothetical protein CcaverHIS002_0212610 [Cutaneotrichosporon cavernicola]BEI89899.1 hypothetical protein CcaverHIS019_0212610 [Cutaneotrichosporon cavernicola]BEI97670.1 hypothetical protein CcaverHIS631_0212590 [Cutaneotrichosporon cavernicola]BEJ05447.1 hypothetical protein CcaverHIS641_0212640 [Cutaneotrichosporon cavernicola]